MELCGDGFPKNIWNKKVSDTKGSRFNFWTIAIMKAGVMVSAGQLNQRLKSVLSAAMETNM